MCRNFRRIDRGFAAGNFGEPGALALIDLSFRELWMSSTDGEIGMRNLTDKATYERLEKDVAAVKDDIAALTDQITDALNSFAGTARKQARRGYKQARANVDAAVDDLSDRGSAVMDAAQDAANSIEEIAGGRDSAASAGDRRSRARTGFPDRRGVAPLTAGDDLSIGANPLDLNGGPECAVVCSAALFS